MIFVAPVVLVLLVLLVLRMTAGPTTDSSAPDASRGEDGGADRLAAIAGLLTIAAGIALAAMRAAGASPVEQGLEGLLGAAALGAIVAAPGVLALLSLRGRPMLRAPAAVILVPLSFFSLAGATLPLLVPAALLFVAHGRRSERHRRSAPRTAPTTLAVLSLLFAAGVALLAHDDPRTHRTATSTHSTSDVITYAESLLSLALSTAAVGTGWALSAPEEG